MQLMKDEILENNHSQPSNGISTRVLYSSGDPVSTNNNPASPIHKQFNKTKTRVSHRITLEEFILDTSTREREALKKELCRAILYYIESDIPVYLENFGILIPRLHSKNVTRNVFRNLNLRREHFRSISFEKCDDLTSYNRSNFVKIAETRELADRIHPRLPLFININWGIQDTRRFMRGLLLFLRNETITSGHSRLLEPVGVFHSLHNRQGNTPRDWFAGADILLKPTYSQLIKVGESQVYQRPVFKNAWEPLEAAFGKHELQFIIDLEQELQKLGYDTSSLHDFINPNHKQITVRVFDGSPSSDSRSSKLIYCTNGLRKLATSSSSKSGASQKKATGVEFVFQIDQEKARSEHPDIPLWPARAITIAWILLQGSKSGSVKPGIGLSCEVPLEENNSSLDTILLTEFSYLRSEFLSKHGPFSYINITGITKNEAALARDNSFEYLLALLQYKGLDQVSQPGRACLLAKTKMKTAREDLESQLKSKKFWDKLIWRCQ